MVGVPGTTVVTVLTRDERLRLDLTKKNRSSQQTAHGPPVG
jgi:hypothetical protein